LVPLSRKYRMPIPSIHSIRTALESIPGAIMGQPVAEDRAQGSEPGTPVLHIDPAKHSREQPESAKVDQPSDDDATESGDQPTVIFEVPPSLTDAEVRNVLGKHDLGDIKRLAQVKGTEVAAYGWYMSFHQRARQYGIYIPAERVVAFALHVFGSLALSFELKLEIAFQAILRHELFHFEADCMAANWELCVGHAIYTSPKDPALGLRELEEGLANAYMLRGFRHREGILRIAGESYRALKAFCKLQPDGYCDGPHYAKSRGSYLEGCRSLSFFFGSEHEVPPGALDTAIFYPNPFRVDWRRCPILVHDELGLLRTLGIDLSLFDTITGIVESKEFLKALAKLGPRFEAMWARRKADLSRSVQLSFLGLQRWKAGGSDCYSVRLDGNYRVHLLRDPSRNAWIAAQVGDHKSMGHG
jgi:hypothetical protein